MKNKSTQIKIETMSNIGKRSSQQDAFGISDLNNAQLLQQKGILCVLADGMGGLSGGEEASVMTVTVCQEFFRSMPVQDTPDQALLQMAYQANRNVLRDMERTGTRSGSTLIASLLAPDGMYFVSVGDSRICLLRGSELLTLNRQHVYASVLDKEAAQGIRSAEEARNHPERNSLTSYIGKEDLKLVDYNRIPVRLIKGDRVLLMSDGVFNTLSDDTLVGILKKEKKDAAKALSVIQMEILGRALPAQDNFTAILIQMF